MSRALLPPQVMLPVPRGNQRRNSKNKRSGPLLSCLALGAITSGILISVILCACASLSIGVLALSSPATPPPRLVRPTPLPPLTSLAAITSQPGSPTPPTSSTPTPDLLPMPTLPPAPTLPAPTPSLKMAIPGQRTESSGLALTVNNVTREATEETNCLTVDITLENINHEPLIYNPIDFRVIRGGESLEQTMCGVNDQPLAVGELGLGNQIQGKISFQQLPPADPTNPTPPLILIYQQAVPAGGYDLITIYLGPS